MNQIDIARKNGKSLLQAEIMKENIREMLTVKPTKQSMTLADHLWLRGRKRAATTGFHKCGCGVNISRNKTMCLACVNIAAVIVDRIVNGTPGETPIGIMGISPVSAVIS